MSLNNVNTMEIDEGQVEAHDDILQQNDFNTMDVDEFVGLDEQDEGWVPRNYVTKSIFHTFFIYYLYYAHNFNIFLIFCWY